MSVAHINAQSFRACCVAKAAESANLLYYNIEKKLPKPNKQKAQSLR